MPCCDLDVTQRHPRVERRHDESGTEHVGVDDPEAGPLADGADPAVRRASVEPLTVVAMQDRSLASLAEGKVDRPGHPGDQGNHGRLVALPDDAQRPMPPPKARSSASVAQASLTRRPFRPSKAARAAWSES